MFGEAPFSHRRRRLSVVVALAAVSLVPSATAYAAEDPDPLRPEVADYMADEGITEPEARQRLKDQSLMNALDEAVQTRLGSASFGGLWVDRKDNDRIALALVPVDKNFAKTVARAESVVADVGLEGRVNFVKARISHRELSALRSAIETRVAPVNAAAEDTIDVVEDVQTGTIEVGVPDTPSGAQQAVLADEGGAVASPRVKRVPKEGKLLRKQACSDGVCGSPLRGGVKLWHDATHAWDCTSGFVVKSVSDGRRYLTTAGHCLSQAWWTKFPDGSRHDIGSTHNRTTDLQIIRINNASGWNAGPYIRYDDNGQYRIESYGQSYPGNRACFNGTASRLQCMDISGKLGTRGGVPDTYLIDFCSRGGDNGAPVFSYNKAQASHIGRFGRVDGDEDNPCDEMALVQSTSAFSRLLNVVPVTG